uniref:Uncharacterized protein n=1 Tax=Glossina palpalis gambiensis TaxID=67801 RepID=A0A1B0AR46_9MUSC
MSQRNFSHNNSEKLLRYQDTNCYGCTIKLTTQPQSSDIYSNLLPLSASPCLCAKGGGSGWMGDYFALPKINIKGQKELDVWYKVYFAKNFKQALFTVDITGVIRVRERAYKVWIRSSNVDIGNRVLLEKLKFCFLLIPTPAKTNKVFWNCCQLPAHEAYASEIKAFYNSFVVMRSKNNRCCLV